MAPLRWYVWKGIPLNDLQSTARKPHMRHKLTCRKSYCMLKSPWTPNILQARDPDQPEFLQAVTEVSIPPDLHLLANHMMLGTSDVIQRDRNGTP